MILLIFLVVRQVHWNDYEIIEDGKSVIKLGIVSSIKHVNEIVLI